MSSRRFRYWRIQLLIGAFALLLVGRMAAQVVWRVSAPYVIRTIEARLGSVEETFTGPGRAVRAEVVVRSPQQGVVTHLVREGQRVRQGEIVAEVRSPVETGELARRLDQLTERLESARRDAQRRRAAMEAAIEETTAEWERAVGLEQGARATGQFETAERFAELAARLKRELERLHDEAEAAEEAYQKSVADLHAQRAELAEQSEAPVALIRAPAPGIVSFLVDGLETYFRPDADLARMWEQPIRRPQALRDGAAVEVGDPVFRLVDNFSFYVLALVDAAAPLHAGVPVTVGILQPSGDQHRGRILRFADHPDGLLVLAEVSAYEPSFTQLRSVNVRLGLGSSEGIVLPAHALIDVEGRVGVYLWLGDRAVFRPVEVRGRGGPNVSVSGIPEGARVVLNPRLAARF